MRPSNFAALALAAFALSSCGRTEPKVPKEQPLVLTPSSDRGKVDTVRRVCLQFGLGTPNTGGGSIVFATGPADNDGVGIETLRGDRTVVPTEIGANGLCIVAPHAMRICPTAPAQVIVEEGLGTNARAIKTLPPNAPITMFDYVVDGPVTKAVVDLDGKARFVLADLVCHLAPIAARSRATELLAMNTSVTAGPKAFRPRSLAAIRRVVIHNTEVPLKETFDIFSKPTASTSAHIVIDRDGTTYRIVEDQFSAFHAGASKDALGGFNSTALGIEVVAHHNVKYGSENGDQAFFTDAQQAAVVRLVDFWMTEYQLTIDEVVMTNTSAKPGYNDVEYSRASLTIHRLTKADRGTDCPRLLFPTSPEGDEEFFRWRERTFSKFAAKPRD